MIYRTTGFYFDMSHSLARALKNVTWIIEKCSVKKSGIHVSLKNIYITKGRIVHTGDGASIVEKFPDIIATLAKSGEPLSRYCEELAGLTGKPLVDFEQMIDCSGKSE